MILINRNFQTALTLDDSLRSKSLATTSIVPRTRIPHNDTGLFSPADDRIFTGTSSNPLSIVISLFSPRRGIAHICFASFTLEFSVYGCSAHTVEIVFSSQPLPLKCFFGRRTVHRDVQSVGSLFIFPCFIIRDWRH